MPLNHGIEELSATREDGIVPYHHTQENCRVVNLIGGGEFRHPLRCLFAETLKPKQGCNLRASISQR